MPRIKHISLDAWNTLLQPNPAYAEARSYEIANMFGCSFSYAQSLYSETKLKCDKLAEFDSISLTPEQSIQKLIFESGIDPRCIDVEKLQMRFYQRFNENQPKILTDISDAMTEVHRKYGITFNISSNTNFISGFILGPMIRITLKSRQCEALQFAVFSDTIRPYTNPIGANIKLDKFFGHPNEPKEHCVRPAKPGKDFFQFVANGANIAQRDTLLLAEILHIGDSMPCDFQGATAFGFRAKKIKGPSDVAQTILDAVE